MSDGREADLEEAWRWIGFAAGVAVSIGTVVGVMKTLIVPRRSWSLVPTFIGRGSYQVFHGIAIRFRSYDLADRFLGFLAPVTIIGILVTFLAAFVLAFGLMLLPFGNLTFSEALRESGSSIFTLGFVSTPEPIPTTLDVLAGATGMVFVALTMGYLPTLYSEIKKRESLVKQLEGWTGVPSWGPEVLARFSLAGGVDRLPKLYNSWDYWAAQVADTHMKYPVLTQFRLPRARNHWLIALMAVMDAAAMDIALRPNSDHAAARLLLNQGNNCLLSVSYPMRRIAPDSVDPGIDVSEFRKGVDRVVGAGYPAELSADQAWEAFAGLRGQYAPRTYQLAYWIIAAPAPWSGHRAGFSEIDRWPDSPEAWSLNQDDAEVLG